MLDARARVALARENLAAGGSIVFRIRGGSMRPFLREGMEVEVEPVRPEDVRIGDVVAVVVEGQLAAHRVVGFVPGAAPRRILTRGDACTVPDAPIDPADLIGRVRRVIAGRVTVDLSRPVARFAGAAAARCAPFLARLLAIRARRARGRAGRG